MVVISKFNIEPEDSNALSVFKSALPGKTIVQVDSSSIIQRSGALHCIAQHVFNCARSDPNTPPPTQPPGANQDPIAVASANPQTVTAVPSQVTLDGTGSSDPDGTIQNYVWTIGANLIGSGGTLTVTVDSFPTTYTLTVTDNDGATGTDSVEITLESNPTCVASRGSCAGSGKVCCSGTCPSSNPKKCP